MVNYSARWGEANYARIFRKVHKQKSFWKIRIGRQGDFFYIV
jgi:hypothetical protein